MVTVEVNGKYYRRTGLEERYVIVGEPIKCEYNYEDGANDESELDYIDVPETSMELEEENLLGDTASQNYEFTYRKDSNYLVTKGLSGIFRCFRCDFSCTSTKDLIAHYQRYREKEPFKCFQCGYDGKDRQDFINHSRSHLQRTYFKCSKCSFKGETSSAMKAHIQEGHPKVISLKMNAYKCPLCDKTVSSKWNLKLHLPRCKGPLKETPDQSSSNYFRENKDDTELNMKQEPDENGKNSVFTCPYCFFIFSSKSKRTKHIYNVHFRKKKLEGENVIKVSTNVKSKIPTTFEPNTESDEIFEVGPDMNPSVKLERIYLCPICHYVFTSVSSLNKHIITHKTLTECPICKFECETNFELKEHIATHSSEESKHPCTICDMKFPTLGKLKYHIKDEHSKKFRCNYCMRTIKTENALRLHIEAHSKVKEYYCPKCKFTAKNSSLLQYHMSRFHPPKKRFICENCNKSYKYKYSLQRHDENCPCKDLALELKDPKNEDGAEIEIDISQKEKLSCSECKASFKEAIHLKKHLLVHFHRTPFRCMKCGLRCKTKPILSEHMKIHNMKANYECKLCHKRFKHRHALNNHSIIHSDERPFACEVCGLTFKRKANYRRHYDIHSDIKPFRCHSCSFTSRRKDGLQKHLLTHLKTC